MQDHIVEGEHGWVLQGVLSRASFRRAAVSGQKVFTASSRGIAKKIIQTIRAAGGFNGAAWRCRSRDNISTIDEKFSAYAAGPHTVVGDPDPSRTIGLTSVVFFSLRAPSDSGK